MPHFVLIILHCFSSETFPQNQDPAPGTRRDGHADTSSSHTCKPRGVITDHLKAPWRRNATSPEQALFSWSHSKNTLPLYRQRTKYSPCRLSPEHRLHVPICQFSVISEPPMSPAKAALAYSHQHPASGSSVVDGSAHSSFVVSRKAQPWVLWCHGPLCPCHVLIADV